MQKTAAGTAHSAQKSQSTSAEVPLVHCYRQIGISAVAAAVRYQGSGKNPAYAPVPAPKMLDWATDAA
jgi:hypothetical protein